MSDRPVDLHGDSVFLKKARTSELPMFEAEVDGLSELRATNTIRVPDVLACGVADGESYIALERLTFETPTTETERRLGKRLADLHRHCENRFGWFRDNTIGPTAQKNGWLDNWADFFRDRRLKFQLELAVSRGYGDELTEAGAKLVKRLPEIFADYEPDASLLHGDLWGGNWACVNGEPVIFDPAVYYGDRETDIAMTRLFGGFGEAFYEAYEASWPLAAGHEQRCHLYQLYHVHNDLNLFGRSYMSQAKSLLRDLL